jgi:hypothetical protein
MDRLRNKLSQQYETFNVAEPAEGHFERFREKLGPQISQKQHGISYYLKVAAIIVGVSVSSILVYEMLRPDKISESYTFGTLSQEFRDAEDYFLKTIQTKYSEIEQIQFDDPEQKELILKELEEMDQLYKQLVKDFNTDPDNEMVVNAMIQHYQLKINILNNILIQLEEINILKSNLKSHENTEI